MRKKPLSIIQRDKRNLTAKPATCPASKRETNPLQGPPKRSKQATLHSFSEEQETSARRIERRQQSTIAEQRPSKRCKQEVVEGNTGALKADKEEYKLWSCRSVVDRQAADIINNLLSAQRTGRRGASIKTLTLAPHIQAKQATFKVTCETLKHLSAIERLLEESQVLVTHRRLSKSIAYVLCYEVVFGEGLKPHGPAERAILEVKNQLKAAYVSLEEARAATSDKPPLQLHPRYARVNLLKLTVKEALSRLRTPRSSDCPCYEGLAVDSLLPDVLVFPAGTDLHDHPMVLNSQLILQSKASCMPAHALAPEASWTILDACAAPGNKTTHLAALMRGEGKIMAFDRDPKRWKRLEANVQACEARSVTARCQDFLATDPTSAELKEVQGILLDPSCSGSGTEVSRLGHLLPKAPSSEGEKNKQQQRLSKLAKFQVQALQHALKFPSLRRLVYSTCSVHAEENELVVAAVLEEAKAKGFRLVDPFPGWKRRGLRLVKGSKKLIRTDPALDNTDGFFLAVFQRIEQTH